MFGKVLFPAFQHSHHRRVQAFHPHFACYLQCSLALVIASVYVCSALEEHVNHVRPSKRVPMATCEVFYSHMQRCLALPILQMDVCLLHEQQANHSDTRVLRSVVQGRLTAHGLLVADVCLLLQQSLDHVTFAVPRGIDHVIIPRDLLVLRLLHSLHPRGQLLIESTNGVRTIPALPGDARFRGKLLRAPVILPPVQVPGFQSSKHLPAQRRARPGTRAFQVDEEHSGRPVAHAPRRKPQCRHLVLVED
mmetsp:Transcript_62226/g.146025  ORF Transcript_62226/g.146025 Transcript_62226/m.146025 type:complete len:249 (+) Transcript_62226:63-809(+)